MRSLFPNGRSSIRPCLLGIAIGLAGNTALRAEDFRTWSDASGKFKIEAKFVAVEDDKAILLNKEGKRLAIPLAKLSDKDRGYLEAKMGESPFEVVGEATKTKTPSNTPSASSTPKNSVGTGTSPDKSTSTAPTKPKEIDVDFQSAEPQTVLVGSWSVKPDLLDAPAPKFKPFELPASKIDREAITRVASNLQAQRMVVSYSPNDPFKKERNGSTRLVVVDLTTGKVVGNTLGSGRWEAMAIHDDGETIVVSNKTEGTPLGQLGTVKVAGSKLTAVDLWSPYKTLAKEDKEKDVTFAEFANNGKLVTVCQNGNVVVWNFETKEPISRFDYHGACQPSLSPNRKHLGFSGGGVMGVFDVDAGEILSVKAAPQMNFWLKSAFSPSGKRFAAATMAKLMVWEVDSGEVLFEGSFDGIPLAHGLQFPNEDYMLVSNDYLVELKSRIKLWQFVGTNYMTRLGSTPVFGVNNGGGMRFLPIALPTPDAEKMLETALKQPDLFVWRKGVDVRIDVDGVPSQFQAEVSKALNEQAQRMNCRVSPTAAITLKALVSGPKAEAVSYFFGGNFVLQQYQSTLQIVYGGNPIWSGAATNTPGAISRGSKEEMQKQIDEAGQKPNISYFAATALPEFLQRPEPNATGGRNKQTIGVSRVTATGLQAEK